MRKGTFFKLNPYEKNIFLDRTIFFLYIKKKGGKTFCFKLNESFWRPYKGISYKKTKRALQLISRKLSLFIVRKKIFLPSLLIVRLIKKSGAFSSKDT